MKHFKYVLGAANCIPRELHADDAAMRPEVGRLVALVDTEDPAWPLVAAILREMAAAGVELEEPVIQAAIKVGQQRWARGEDDVRPSNRPLALAAASESIVYYVRRGDLIKIGTTVMPAKRFASLLPDEILAVEPGGYDEEAARHRQFRHLKGMGEHFRIAPELLEHIRRVRELNGDPDPAWATSATYQTGQRHANALRPAIALPKPVSGETLTAAEAVDELGINNCTLRGWVRRRKLFPAGHNEEGRQVFYVEHLIFLRDGAS